jgi:TolA-binding protein
MKTTERHHLKSNEVAETVARVRAALESGGAGIWRTLLALAVVAALALAFLGWRNYTASKAQALLADALTTDSAAIVPPPPPPAPGQPAPQPPPAGSFPTEQARRDAALAKYVAAADAHPATREGRLARYRAASLYAEMGKLADAEREFKAIAESGGSDVFVQMARLGVADLQVRQGQYDPAIATFRELAMRTDGALPVDGVLMQLGRAQQLSGKKSEARQTFARVVEEFPQSVYVADARREMDAIGPPAGG